MTAPHEKFRHVPEVWVLAGKGGGAVLGTTSSE